MRILAVATFSVCSLAAALIAIAAIGTADFAMQGRSTAAFPVGETSAVKKVVKKKPIKKSSVPARATMAVSALRFRSSRRHGASPIRNSTR